VIGFIQSKKSIASSLSNNTDLFSFFNSINTNQKEYIRHLPAFIKSYTSFAEELDTIPTELMETIHQMCNIFIMSFADMSGYHRRNGSFYIHQLFGMLYNKGEGVFRNFINSFCK
jgi:hypothetical protein